MEPGKLKIIRYQAIPFNGKAGSGGRLCFVLHLCIYFSRCSFNNNVGNIDYMPSPKAEILVGISLINRSSSKPVWDKHNTKMVRFIFFSRENPCRRLQYTDWTSIWLYNKLSPIAVVHDRCPVGKWCANMQQVYCENYK